MSTMKFYHNPRCSKSRQALAILNEQGIEPTVIEYLKEPPSTAELTAIISALNIKPEQLIRKGEAIYKELSIDTQSMQDSDWINLMAEHPKLIERPIFMVDQSARIGRPPEQVLEIVS